MVRPTRWTGHDARLLRVALRLSQRAFAARLGLAERTVSKWEQAGRRTTPRPDNQAILDTAFAQASDDAQARFRHLVSDHSVDVVPFTFNLANDHAEELAAHLDEQWQLLVKTDNLLGPRYALGGVVEHLQLVKDLLETALPAGAVPAFGQLAARFAESAAWLSEDGGDLAAAQTYNREAMAWAQQVGDEQLRAWTLFRASQLVAYHGDAVAVLALSKSARRHEGALTPPMRAALAQQEAQGHALGGDPSQAHQLFDEAHRWASTDSAGAGRRGHGSFCTPSYIELQRAASLERLGQPVAAVALFESTLPSLPGSYRRDRGVALGNLASAHQQAGDPEQAAAIALDALHIAVGTGSVRTVRRVRTVARRLARHSRLQPVADLVDQLDSLAV